MGYVLPDWVDTLLDFAGINWPNVDEDDYREMADAMRELADAFDDHAGEAHGAVSRLLASSEGWAVDSMQEHWGKVKSSHLEQLPEVARMFADAMDVVADLIYGMKIKAEIELGAMAASVGLAISLIVVTGGLSAFLGAAEIALMREAIRRIIKEAAEQIVEQVIAMVTEPVAAKLEDMVADAVLELTTEAFSPGTGDGSDGKGAAGMNLNSANGSGGGGPGSGGGAGRMRIDHVEYEKAAGDLGRISENSLTRLNGSLDRAHGANNRTKGRDPFTQGFDAVVDGGVKGMKKAITAVIRHNGELVPKNMRDTSKRHKENEKANEDALRKIMGDRDGKGDPNSPSKGPDGPGGKNSPGKSTRTDRPADPELSRKGREAEDKCLGGDPIDMASGEVFLSQTDVKLPGVLSLVLERTHLSNYRHGRFFGPSWASTLDERLERASEHGELWWHRPDGSSLRYDHAPDLVGEDVQPREGKRLPLSCIQGTSGWDLAIHDPRSGLTRRFLPAGQGTSVDVWWLMEVDDRNGNTLIFERDSDGTPTSVSHSSADYHVRVQTDDGLVSELGLQTAEGEVRVMSYGYDTDGNLSEVINSSGLPLRFGYDTDGRLASWTDRNDSTFTYVYDAFGRAERTIGPDGCLSSHLTYDKAQQLTRYTDSLGAVTTYHLNDLGQVIAETDPLGHTSYTEWDRYDQVLSRTDPLGRITRFEYDDDGNTTAVIHPDGSRTQATYNRHHLPTEILLPGDIVQKQEYDAFGNRTSVTDASGATTRFTYSDLGYLTSVTDTLGGTTTIRCNAAGLPLEITEPLGAVTLYSRDAFGRPVAITDPLGATTRLEWTIEGKPARRISADGSTESWKYDGEGNCTSHTDQLGSVSHFEYTHFDLLSARTGRDGHRHTFEHDTELRLAKVTNSQGLTWSYEYDLAGRLAAETDFDNRTRTYAHDAAGQLATQVTTDGEVITFDRDVLGRIKTKDAAGAVTTYAYDAMGLLVEASGPDALLTLQRDSSGRLISESVNGRTLSYTYDALGRRASRTTPSGAVSTWTYDAAGNTTRLTTSGRTLSFARDSAGRELARHIDDRLILTHGFDEMGRPTAQQVLGRNGEELQHRAYAYRADGNVITVDDQFHGARRFELDQAGRVTSVSSADWSESYAYDEAGNQTNASWPAPMPGREAVGTRTYTGTRIRTAGSVRYEHDAAGRITLRQKTRLSRKPDTWRYNWDAEDRLTSVVTPDGTTWRYVYDPLGRRIAKQRLSSDGTAVMEQVDFTWDGTTLCEQTTHAPGSPHPALTLTWDHDGLHPLTQTESKSSFGQGSQEQEEFDSRFYAIVTDLVGTPTELVDECGDIAWRSRSTLWGTTAWNRSATAYTPLRFPGQYFDAESGLHYNYFRHYDPETARYATPDPVGLAPASNPVSYVINPLTWTDPFGLAPKCKARPREGYRSSPFLEDDPYSPESVERRSAQNRAYYETPQDIHDLVDDVVTDPNYPQRETGPADNRRPDFYEANGAPRAAQRWRGSEIYDNGDPLSQARVLVDRSTGNIAYVGRRKDGSHNYNQIIPYPWASMS